jgi:hypothetical protein
MPTPPKDRALPHRDTLRDRALQELFLSRAAKSMAILEHAFIFNGSGRYLSLRTKDLAAALNKTPQRQPRSVKRRQRAKSRSLKLAVGE